MFKLTFLHKENDLNKLLKAQRKEETDMILLFISLWEDKDTQLMRRLIDTYGSSQEGREVFVINSYDMPHSFVIFNTQVTPHLVYVNSKETLSEDYLSKVYDFFELE